MTRRKYTDVDTAKRKIAKECNGGIMELNELREEIDKVDAELIKLYEKRIEIAEQIAAAKIAIDKPVFDAEREKVKLNAVREKTTKDFNKDGVEELFVFLMDKSKERQRIIVDKAELK